MIILLQTGITQSFLIVFFAGDVNSVEVYFESGSESNDKIEVLYSNVQHYFHLLLFK